MALGYEFAPIDVTILGHPKAFAAGVEAMGLWLWGMAFAKQQRTGGRLHRVTVLAAWGGKRNIMLAKRLVDAGLWIARDDGDWEIHNFEKKGPGTSDSAERMRRLRDKRRSEPPPSLEASHVTSPFASHVTGGDANSDVTDRHRCSVSVSVSSSSREGECEREVAPEEPSGVRPSTLRYRESYCSGVAKAKGSPYAWPPGPKSDEWADKDLGHAIATFAKSESTGLALRGETLLGWIAAAAEDFVEHVRVSGDDPKFWSHFAPKGLVRFLNQDLQAKEARRVG